MFDRCSAGWQVVVITTDATHTDALTILGVHAEPAGPYDRDAKQGRSIRTVVAPLELLATTRESTADALLLWGEHPAETSGGVHLQPARRQLSAAARAFKPHALRCTGLRTSDIFEERFWVDDRTPQPASADRSGSRSPSVVGR